MATQTLPVPAYAYNQPTENALTQYYYPSADQPFRDLYRSGWLPSWFNQQWGGAQWGTLPDGSFGSVATGHIENDTAHSISDISGRYYVAQGFKVSETATYDSVWVKLNKTGNPTFNLTVRIYSDTAGAPNAAIGTAVTVSAKKVTNKVIGEWIQLTGLNVALTAGTQYHIVLSSLAAVDGTNYVNWKSSTSKKYPYGNYNAGTSVPAWTPTTTVATCFLIQNPAANSLLQASGQFDYKLAFAPGSPVNQSRSVAQPLVNFYDGKNCSVLHRGTYAISTNVWDFAYGLDHDRITLTVNASGFPVVTLYENVGTVHTVTGAASITTGFHDVGIRVRTVGDGADYLTLYVDGVSVGTPLTAQTFTMDVNMAQLGTARLGDGFGIAPAWTGNAMTDTTQLPSHANNGSWTWTGTATEANAMSMQGGKLYQNASGYTSTQTGYYAKTVVFNNTTGWTVSIKTRCSYSINALHGGFSGDFEVAILDGTKQIGFTLGEYFLASGVSSTTPDFIIQGDFRSQEHVFTICGKGSDYYLFIDGKLVLDGTGKLTSAIGTNQILFGDISNTASENSDVVWSYLKYYQGGMLAPVATTGTCSEFAHWSGDRSVLYSSLWNAGAPVSVKSLMGMPKNYQYEKTVQYENRVGVAAFSTTAVGGTGVLVSDMELYTFGSNLDISTKVSLNSTQAAGNTVYLSTSINGFQNDASYFSTPVASYTESLNGNSSVIVPLGLHKVENKALQGGAGTLSSSTTTRNLIVKATS